MLRRRAADTVIVLRSSSAAIHPSVMEWFVQQHASRSHLPQMRRAIASSASRLNALEPVEPIEAVQNVGEFPTVTDQSEGRYPEPRSGKRFGRSGNNGS